MPNDPSVLAAIRAARDIIAGPEDEDEGEFETSPERLLDLAVFYRTVGLIHGSEAEDAPGTRLAHRYTREFIANIDEQLAPVLDRQGMKTVGRLWTRPGSKLKKPLKDMEAHTLRGKFVVDVLGVMTRKSDLMKNVFGEGATLLNAKRLAEVASAKTREEALEALGHVRLLGPMTTTRRYVMATLAKAGTLSDFDNALSDATSAQSLGDEIRKIDTEMLGTEDSDKKESLSARRGALVQQVDALASASAAPEAVVGAAAQAAITDSSMETEIGKKLFRSDKQQENAMMIGTRRGPDGKKLSKSHGKSVIAAGAGSGKTRVLAGRVVYLALPPPQGLGVPPHQVLATSFTRASAAELGERINEYSKSMGNPPIVQRNAKNFGTTHAVAARILNSLTDLGVVVGKAPTIGSSSDDTVSPYKLLKMSLTQVKLGMTTPAAAPEPSADESFFSTEALAEIDQASEKAAEEAMQGKTIVNDKGEALDLLSTWLESAAAERAAANPPEGSAWFWTVKYRKNKPNYNVLSVTRRVVGAVRQGYKPSTDMVRRLEEALAMAGIFYEPPAAVSGSTTPPWRLPPPRVLVSAAGKKFYDSPYQSAPANQWFNLDLVSEYAVEEGIPVETVKLKEVNLIRGDGEKMTMGDVSRALDIWKGNLITPGQAWHDPAAASLAGERTKSHLAAAYGAYEWLKKNDLEYQGAYDGNDLFINFSKEMISKPAARAKVNQMFKHILVDEAQDLNSAQHMMFGFIAGALDPATQEPWPDGHMTAETYTLIGDDKQAIYEFRGADPTVFMSRSDMTEGGENWETAVIESNYRSARQIVDGANRLIAYNKGQIPMTCQAMEWNGEGALRSVDTDSYEDTVNFAVDQIQGQVQGEENDAKYGDYGVALRTNAEVLAWTTELLRRNIPFRCKDAYNPLKNRTAAALLNWIKFAHADENDVAIINKLLTGSGQPLTMNPGSGVSAKTLAEKLDSLAAKNSQYVGKSYLQMLEAGAWREVYAGRAAGRNEELVKPMMTNLRQIKNMGKNASPVEVLSKVLDLKGKDNQTMRSTFIERTLEDADTMKNVYIELGENATQEAINAAVENIALTPIQPITSLLENYGTVDSAVDYVTKLEIANNSLQKKDDDVTSEAVVVETIHGWKGLEAAHMYVPMVDTVFPNPRANLESERRLAYVAITRGQQSVTILSPATDHYDRVCGGSQFIEEACVPTATEKSLDEEVVTSDETAPVEGRAQSPSERLSRWGGPPAGARDWTPAGHVSRARAAKETIEVVMSKLRPGAAISPQPPSNWEMFDDYDCDYD